ncbi:MAG TPA: hypothetical protein VJ761_02090 [Ktedonobacteraceae bacterium]|nr:hypothetical protein [Ktedonobacteraceae bacterium]
MGDIPDTTTRVIRAVVVETRYEGSGSLTLGFRLSRSLSPADCVGQESMVEPLPQKRSTDLSSLAWWCGPASGESPTGSADVVPVDSSL